MHKLALATLCIATALAAAPLRAWARDPVLVQGATAFLPPDTPPAAPPLGLGKGLALGVSAGVGTYVSAPHLQLVPLGDGLSHYGEARAGWYVHRTSAVELSFAWMSTTSQHGTLTVYRPGVAYRFRPMDRIWVEAEGGVFWAPYAGRSGCVTASGRGWGPGFQLTAGVVLLSTSLVLVEAEISGSNQIFENSSALGVPFTVGLGIDYL